MEERNLVYFNFSPEMWQSGPPTEEESSQTLHYPNLSLLCSGFSESWLPLTKLLHAVLESCTLWPLLVKPREPRVSPECSHSVCVVECWEAEALEAQVSNKLSSCLQGWGPWDRCRWRDFLTSERSAPFSVQRRSAMEQHFSCFVCVSLRALSVVLRLIWTAISRSSVYVCVLWLAI